MLIPVAMGSVLLIEARRGVKGALLRVAAVGVVSAMGLAAVMVRNLALGAPAVGNRTQNTFGWERIAADTSRTLGGHVLAIWPRLWGVRLWELVGYLTILAIVAALVLVLRRREVAMAPVSIYVVAYWSLLLYSERATTIDPVGPRLTVPVLAPMVILLAWAGSRLQIRAVAGLAVAAAAGVVVLNLLPFAEWRAKARDERGYASAESMGSPLARSLAAPAPGQVLAVSDLQHTYWSTGIDAVMPVPRVDRWTTPARTEEMTARLRDAIDRGVVTTLVFFDRNTAGPLKPEQLVKLGINIRRAARFADGEVWVPATAPQP